MSLQSTASPQQFKDQQIIKMLKARKETVVRVAPLNKTTFAPGENMKIRISDTSGYADFSTAYFTYTIVSSNSLPATTGAITPNSESIFRRVMVMAQNGQVIEDYDHRDVLHNGMVRHTMGQDAASTERSVMSTSTFIPANNDNYPTFSSRHQARTAANAPSTFGPLVTSALQLGFFGSKNLWPLKYMGSLLLDIDLNSINVICESVRDDTGAGIVDTEKMEIKNVEFVYTSVEYGDEFDAIVKEQISSPDGMKLKYDTFVSHVDTAGVSGEITSKINLASSSLKGIYTLIRPSNSVGQGFLQPLGANTKFVNGGHNYRFGYASSATAFNEANNADPAGTNINDTYNYQISNKLYPSFNAKVKVNAYPELLKALSRFGDVSKGSLVRSLTGPGYDSYLGGDMSGTTAANSLTGGSFMLGVTCEQLGEDGLMSGVDTRGSLDVQLRLDRGADSVAIQLNHYSHVDRTLVLMPNNEVLVVK